jgi:two-component system nitrogen regulation response regulator GlnG
LVVDDEAPLVSGYRMALMRGGMTNLICHTDSREALKVIQTQLLDLIILDLNMPHITGEALLAKAVEYQPGVPVLVVTGKDTIESAVYCIKQGAYDYWVKPVSAERIVTGVRNALQKQSLQRENRQLNEHFLIQDVRHPEYFADFVTRDPMMKSIFVYIEAIASTDHPVLLTGETGVGKELVARAIHRASGRKGSFVAVNIAGLDDTMFSDTLFGHAKGAFTGADSPRAGLIAQALGGTLFLDEIGDLSILSQVKLLRLLQEQEYTPLGQDRPVSTDARIIVATNADLSKLQDEGKFRSDLFYRLCTHKIHMPPLRKRPDDLGLLLDHFLANAARQLNKKKPSVPKELIPLLSTYGFPGNVRELEAMVIDAVSRHTSHVLSLKSFKEHVGIGSDNLSSTSPHDPEGTRTIEDLFGEKLPSFKEVKKLLVEEALRRANGNRTRAAELLGTSRQALSWYLQNPE